MLTPRAEPLGVGARGREAFVGDSVAKGWIGPRGLLGGFAVLSAWLGSSVSLGVRQQEKHLKSLLRFIWQRSTWCEIIPGERG